MVPAAPPRAAVADDIASTLAFERAAMQEDFTRGFLELAFLVICSFGVPAGAVMWRGRQKRRGDERINFLVRHDAATGLYNRAYFIQSLEERLRTVAVTGELAALHFIDIDRFKTINDTLGHSGGDSLIVAVADRLSLAKGVHDFVGRLGGDEFVFLQGRLGNAEEAGAKAHQIRAMLAHPFHLASHDLSVTASIGVAIAPIDGDDAVTLMHAADTAMYRAKAGGRDAIFVYDPEMDVKLQERRAVEDALRRALADGCFALHFQPIFEAQGETLVGFEALLRLSLGDGKMISPAVFVPVAEEMGIITRIGAWVVEEACRVARDWPEPLIVAVNLSPKQLDSDDIQAVVGRALAASGLPAHRLELEITEGVVLEDTESVIARLRHLKALGISIAMDDFGTGYSSLSSLWRFPFDKLKIDRSFISNLHAADENVLNILKTIVSLGRSLRLQVTAEGIESQTQADLLRGLKCDQLQGYHFGRPAPACDLGAFIARSLRARPARVA
jgi:diguanylate cyclase (GGDEF)-like protein